MEPGTVSQAMIGGWFMMLEPLAPGSHMIEVSDDIDIPDDDQGHQPWSATRSATGVGMIGALANAG